MARLLSLGAAGLVLALFVAPAAVLAQAPASQVAQAQVSMGKSQVIELPEAYADVMVADPKVADVLPLNARAVYVVGKGIGSTALTLYGPNKRLIAAINVVVGGDLDGLRRNLAELLPDEKAISLRQANQSIVLSGRVSSPGALQQALALAEPYAPGKIINLLGVEGTQQVMLSVRFVEMERTTAKELRLNVQRSGASGAGNASLQIVTGDTLNADAKALVGSFGQVLQTVGLGGGDVNLLVDALEKKGLVKTLAEPNLVANSGDTASFLAGGEFPIPVQQNASSTGGAPSITVDFKQFGVALGFTPTILSGGMINLAVAPEVSSIDASNSIDLGVIRIPGIKTRRANTTVELRDGESFTIAGLLQDDYSSQVRQYPFLGDLPVLGALFRSNGFLKSQTELVIVVTPHLVSARKGKVATPADGFAEPTNTQRFLFGAQEKPAPATADADGGDRHVLD